MRWMFGHSLQINSGSQPRLRPAPDPRLPWASHTRVAGPVGLLSNVDHVESLSQRLARDPEMPSKGPLRAVNKQYIDKPVPYGVQIYFVK
jgi:hypothetical protein